MGTAWRRGRKVGDKQGPGIMLRRGGGAARAEEQHERRRQHVARLIQS